MSRDNVADNMMEKDKLPLIQPSQRVNSAARLFGSLPNVKGSNNSLEDLVRAQKSIIDSDSEDETAVQVPRRKSKPTRVEASPPKKALGQLNAYGIPLTGSVTFLRKSATDNSDRIRVCVRKRPLSKKELRSGQTDIAPVTGRRSITILEPKVKVDLTKFVETHDFVFDEAFDSDATNDDVYKRTAQPLVDYAFSGGKATCFA
jgi:Kinesin motor domain